ncbi:hypothetical protein QEN19_000434 [Hanseniaspora menglaensis]
MAKKYHDASKDGVRITSIGINPKLIPDKIDTSMSLNVLMKPFKLPYPGNAEASVIKETEDWQDSNMRASKRRAKEAIRGIESTEGDNEILQEDDYMEQANKKKKINALSSQNLKMIQDSHAPIEKLNFKVPIKNYKRTHIMDYTLGNRPRIQLESLKARPLHDPYGELSILLYDPTADGDMPDLSVEEDRKAMEILNEANGLNEKLNKRNKKKQEVIQEEVVAKIIANGILAKKMTNGIENKSLTALLPPVFTISEEEKLKILQSQPNVPIVIDPKLAKILRPHQVEGVRFLYRCVTGLVMQDFIRRNDVLEGINLPNLESTEFPVSIEDEAIESDNSNIAAEAEYIPNEFLSDFNDGSNKSTDEIVKKTVSRARNAYGCIMADEMGLGKTLQCLALLWTLIKQGPRGSPMIQKAIIVCPSSLVGNWANEIIKWLGPNTLTPLAMTGKKQAMGGLTVQEAIKGWAAAQNRQITRPVLIISYETLRLNIKSLNGCEVGLLLADEGHRLKNEESLTFKALNSINCNRRVILSGTPIQNDLSEYFALLNFSNPGLLGSRADFRKNFESPILLGRDADATDKEVTKGSEKLKQLSEIVSKFIIRRTNDILAKYLPCKYEHVIFVNLTPFQKDIYKEYVSYSGFDDVEVDDPEILNEKSNGTSTPLRAIGILKKICNHPDLIDLDKEVPELESVPSDYKPVDFQRMRSSKVQHIHSGKFLILYRMLKSIRQETDDKIVLISNYTQTLDLIEIFCNMYQYGFIRLDGTQTVNKRSKIVDRFNDPNNTNDFIFLLSSKAGGCGINLIGANRLILMDPDWNPAADQQALARVWRDGQKKDCFIYRFISTGTIEEKIYQRQSMKMSLSSCVVDENDDVERLFSADNLKKLFIYDEQSECDTHTTFNCKRCINGQQRKSSKTMLYGDATSWNHLNHEALKNTNDHLLREEYNHQEVSYAFQYISHV